ncbi:MAG: hypothetical protein M0P01_09910 [Treponema sp.]|nr:hypothetical protein [Treponema sp.]
MNRVELIFSQALEEDFIEAFRRNMIQKFTELPAVRGQGFSTPKLGDEIWPQLNAMMIVYCGDEDEIKIEKIVAGMREKYVTEGIACFVSKAHER